MATLKDHQQAMVDLLASGSGIPARLRQRYTRLAHAMHDVIQELLGEVPVERLLLAKLREDSTTPGLNDKALAADVEACRPKDTMFDRARAAERRVKELENTVNQLKDRVAKLKAEQAYWYGRCLNAGILDESQEQAGCRKDDTQESGLSATKGFLVSPGARFVCTQGKDDTQCLHTPIRGNDGGTYCADCGADL